MSRATFLEPPFIPIATININDNLKGRIQAESIINCNANKEDITSAFNIAKSEEFRKKIEDVTNPYGNGTASTQIMKILRSLSPASIRHKTFYDIR